MRAQRAQSAWVIAQASTPQREPNPVTKRLRAVVESAFHRRERHSLALQGAARAQLEIDEFEIEGMRQRGVANQFQRFGRTPGVQTQPGNP